MPHGLSPFCCLLWDLDYGRSRQCSSGGDELPYQRDVFRLVTTLKRIDAAAVPHSGQGAWIYFGVQLPTVINPIESFQREKVCPRQNLSGVENPLRVEVNGRFPDGEADIQRSSPLKKFRQVGNADSMPIRVDGVSVSSQTEVFQGVQAGHRVIESVQPLVEVQKITLDELDGLVADCQRSHIHYFNGAERGYMRHKTVDAASDINVPSGVGLMDQPRDEQILMEVMSLGNAGLIVEVTKDRIQASNRAALALELSQLRDVARDVSVGPDGNRVEPEKNESLPEPSGDSGDCHLAMNFINSATIKPKATAKTQALPKWYGSIGSRGSLLSIEGGKFTALLGLHGLEQLFHPLCSFPFPPYTVNI